MAVYEIPADITTEGALRLPPEVLAAIQHENPSRVIVLLGDDARHVEIGDWKQLAAEHMIEAYSDTDSIYDRL